MKGSSIALERTVEKSVQEFRPVLHVLGAAVVAGPLLLEVDDDPRALVTFLRIARGFEATLDQHAAASD